MHAPTAILSKLVHDTARNINNGVRGIAAHAAKVDHQQLLKGAMIVALSVGTFTPMVFAHAPLALPVAQASLAIFTGLLITVILI